MGTMWEPFCLCIKLFPRPSFRSFTGQSPGSGLDLSRSCAVAQFTLRPPHLGCSSKHRPGLFAELYRPAMAEQEGHPPLLLPSRLQRQFPRRRVCPPAEAQMSHPHTIQHSAGEQPLCGSPPCHHHPSQARQTPLCRVTAAGLGYPHWVM